MAPRRTAAPAAYPTISNTCYRSVTERPLMAVADIQVENLSVRCRAIETLMSDLAGIINEVYDPEKGEEPK